MVYVNAYKIEYLINMLLCTACPRGHPYYVGEVSFRVTDLHSVVYTYHVTKNFRWTLHIKKKNSPIPSYFCITEIIICNFNDYGKVHHIINKGQKKSQDKIFTLAKQVAKLAKILSW